MLLLLAAHVIEQQQRPRGRPRQELPAPGRDPRRRVADHPAARAQLVQHDEVPVTQVRHRGQADPPEAVYRDAHGLARQADFCRQPPQLLEGQPQGPGAAFRRNFSTLTLAPRRGPTIASAASPQSAFSCCGTRAWASGRPGSNGSYACATLDRAGALGSKPCRRSTERRTSVSATATGSSPVPTSARSPNDSPGPRSTPAVSGSPAACRRTVPWSIRYQQSAARPFAWIACPPGKAAGGSRSCSFNADSPDRKPRKVRSRLKCNRVCNRSQFFRFLQTGCCSWRAVLNGVRGRRSSRDGAAVRQVAVLLPGASRAYSPKA